MIKNNCKYPLSISSSVCFFNMYILHIYDLKILFRSVFLLHFNLLQGKGNIFEQNNKMKMNDWIKPIFKKIGAFPGIDLSWVCSLVVYRSRRMLSICTAFPNILLEAYFLIWLYLVKLLYDYSVFCMQCHKTCRCYYIAGISSPPKMVDS